MSDFTSSHNDHSAGTYQAGYYLVNTHIEYNELMMEEEEDEYVEFLDDDEIIMHFVFNDDDGCTKKDINVRFPEKHRYNLAMYLREVADMLENK